MNKRDFIKSAAVMAGVSAITPFATVLGKNTAPSAAAQRKTKVSLKKALVFGMIPDKGSLTDKFKIARKNVWNNFILSSVEARRYVDELNHPEVSGGDPTHLKKISEQMDKIISFL